MAFLHRLPQIQWQGQGRSGSKRLMVAEIDSTQQHFPTVHCQCGDTHQAGLPQSLSTGLMGANVLAFVAVKFHQRVSKIQQQLEQNFGLRFSPGLYLKPRAESAPC